jgi:thiamine biosynthesis lipoprotein
MNCYKRSLYIYVGISLLLQLFYAASLSSEEASVERVQFHMGTYARVLIYGGDNQDAEAAFDTIGVLDDLLSDYKPESEISRINSMAGKESVKASGEVIEILNTAKSVARETGGSFDPTIGALTIGVYRFGRESGSVPSDEAIVKARSLVNYKWLRVEDGRAYLEKEGMMIDLGGIGKGYAVDKAVGRLKDRGVWRGLVSLSGDIRVFGRDTRIGIKNPSEKGTIASFKTGKGDIAISTSGGYERVIDPGGKDYHHLLVPETGKPGRDFLSVTVVMRGNSALADAYATALFTMGREKAMEFLNSRADIGFFAVYSGGEIYYNDAFTDIVSDLKIGN